LFKFIFFFYMFENCFFELLTFSHFSEEHFLLQHQYFWPGSFKVSITPRSWFKVHFVDFIVCFFFAFWHPSPCGVEICEIYIFQIIFFLFIFGETSTIEYIYGGSVHSHWMDDIISGKCGVHYKLRLLLLLDSAVCTIYAPWPNRDEKRKKGTRRTRCEMPYLGIELTSRHILFYGVCWMLYMKSIRKCHGIARRTVPKKK
jgi:hypothetical protein